jgi:transposase
MGPVLDSVREQLKPYYSETGRPSVDPELMIRVLIVGYCYGLRSERRLTQEVALHLAYRWFCRLDLDDKVPHHSTFSENRLHRFRESDVFRHIFERVVAACMTAGLVKGEGFAVDASVMEANASRYHGKAPEEIVWAEPERHPPERFNAAKVADFEMLDPHRVASERDAQIRYGRPTSSRPIRPFADSVPTDVSRKARERLGHARAPCLRWQRDAHGGTEPPKSNLQQSRGYHADD